MKTIVAVVTELKNSTIGIIRVSGEDAIKIANSLFKKNIQKKRELKDIFIKEKFIDSVLINTFFSPNSFTGENVVEIMFHANEIISDEIIKKLLQEGARMAKRGEFLEQAFLNGKTSIWKAQLTNEIIKAPSKVLLNLYRSKYKDNIKNRKLSVIRDRIEEILMKSDFADEYPEYEPLKNLEEKIIEGIKSIKKEISLTLAQINRINSLESGFKIAITGPTNVGKSTLFNALLKKDRAIISTTPGTTRDYIEDKYYLNVGIDVSLVDTAGLRETKNIIEEEGIKKSKEIKKKANLIIYVDDYITIKDFSPKKERGEFIHIVTKKDLCTNKKYEFKNGVIFISALNKKDIKVVREEINKKLSLFKKEILEGELVFKSDKALLKETSSTLNKIIKELNRGITIDVQRERLQNCLSNINIVLGEEKTYSYLEKIFRTFCIGK